jgi:hypothetical protein
MRPQTFSYHRAGGWTAPSFPDWHSERTLVTGELSRAYPRSPLAGCTTAGQVHGTPAAAGRCTLDVQTMAPTTIAET